MDLYLQFPSFRPWGARSAIACEWGYKRREDIGKCMRKIKKWKRRECKKEGRKEGRKERRKERRKKRRKEGRKEGRKKRRHEE